MRRYYQDLRQELQAPMRGQEDDEAKARVLRVSKRSPARSAFALPSYGKRIRCALSCAS